MVLGRYRNPPTEKQLKKLINLGYAGPKPISSYHASLEILKFVKPSARQLDELRILGYTGDTPLSGYEASILIAENKKVSIPQIAFLHNLGYDSRPPKTQAEASKIIDRLKEKKKEPILGDICPECHGSQSFDDGHISLKECPYCGGSGLAEDFDQGRGDEIISEKEVEFYNQDEDNYYS